MTKSTENWEQEGRMTRARVEAREARRKPVGTTGTEAPLSRKSQKRELEPKPQSPTPGLGRVRLPNPGSLNFPLDESLPRRALAAPAWKSKRWQFSKGGAFRSQGQTSHCVRFGCTHLLMLTPIIRLEAFEITERLYPWAQANDPWPGAEPTYYGTSVDAGLQYLRKIAKVIDEYRWARNMDEVLGRLSVSAKEGGGPMVLGSDWYQNMSEVGEDGLWHPTGELWGGHCYLAIGHEAPTAKRGRRIVLGNSHEGNFVGRMDADEFEWLIFAQGGEAAAVTELPK